MTRIATASVRRLGGALGAEIGDVDLRALDDETTELLRAALLEHALVVFRGQFLDADALAACMSRFGELYHHGGPIEGHPEMLLIANMPRRKVHADDEQERRITEVWHADYTFWAEPPAILAIAAQELPAFGGDTLFTDLRLAFETLSPRLQDVLRGLDALHEPPAYRDDEPTVHPVVARNPDSGRESLYLNHQAVHAFAGMTRAESAPLLGFLLDHAVRPELVYRHRWQPGDVVVWDNRSTMHYAVDDYGDAPRVLYRTSTVGTRPGR